MCVFGILAVTTMGLPVPNPITTNQSTDAQGNELLAGTYLLPNDPLCGFSIPSSACLDPNSFIVSQYWRIVWGIPALIGVIQMALMICVFRYDTPIILKQRGDYDNLAALMKRLYIREQV